MERPPVYANGTAWFFSLPLEIRWKVYKLVFYLRKRPVYIEEASHSTKDGSSTSKLRSRIPGWARRDTWPSLLFTCRQVYDEASPFLYGNNRFMFWDPEPSPKNTVVKFLQVAGPRNFAYLKNIALGFPGTSKQYGHEGPLQYREDTTVDLGMLGKCSKLEKLGLMVDLENFRAFEDVNMSEANIQHAKKLLEEFDQYLKSTLPSLTRLRISFYYRKHRIVDNQVVSTLMRDLGWEIHRYGWYNFLRGRIG